MPYRAKVVKVMIASPSDVANERQVIRDVILEWDSVHSEDKDLVLLPVGWESHASPLMGERPQAVINKQVLKDCDLLIAVFWTKLGTPTGKSASGTVEEIEEHLKAGKPAMLYFCVRPVAFESIDDKQRKALQKFKEKCRQQGLVEEFDDPFAFKEKLSRQLAHTVLRHFSKKNGKPSEKDVVFRRPRMPDLSAHAKALLREAVRDEYGQIHRMRSMHDLEIRTNGYNLVDQFDPRVHAQWEAAIRQLRDAGLIEDRGRKGEVYGVTDAGYELAVFLPNVPVPAFV